MTSGAPRLTCQPTIEGFRAMSWWIAHDGISSAKSCKYLGKRSPMPRRATVELQKLFDVEHGNKFDLNKMEPGSLNGDGVAFIGRSGERNGIVAIVRRLADEPYPEGLITVALGGSALSSFVQTLPFYTAQNIDILRPNSNMSLDVKLYYCLCIEANRFRYSTYGREANRTLRYLRVPALSSVPNWVEGATETAADELARDLASLVPNTPRRGRRASSGTQRGAARAR